jgi:ABC-type antimicrobial peptide transport system permease subunit
MILNEQAVKVIGIRNPVGETIHFWGKSFMVVGVVGNMLTNSPYQSIEPAIFIEPGWLGVITLRIKPGVPMHRALATMESIFKKYNPGSPFLFHFIDLEYTQKFTMEQRMGDLSAIFAGLAIFISCLGLFGLASFMAEQRTKEIGVRKVLGATLLSLWGLLSRDFVRLALLSVLIAFPLAYTGMHLWLQNYPYRTVLDWWIFASAGAGMVLITLATVSYQSLRAAMRNPSKSLRTE